MMDFRDIQVNLVQLDHQEKVENEVQSAKMDPLDRQAGKECVDFQVQ